MKVKKLSLLVIGGLWLLMDLSGSLYAQEGFKIDKVQTDLCNKASLQRGAKLYVNYCAGCHSLQYIRYKDMAKDIGITEVNDKGKVLDKLVNENLNFTSDKINDPLLTALTKEDAEKWFGIKVPDLSLVARSRGKDWLYTYLRSFYEDPKRPWGVNNALFPDVGMPHILLNLQGLQVPVYKKVTLIDEEGRPYEKQIIDHLSVKTPGVLTKEEYDNEIRDLVNFLQYVGEPHKIERERLGVWVLLFLVIFALFAYLLKREYWKDVH